MQQFFREYFREQVHLWQSVIVIIADCAVEYGIGKFGFLYIVLASTLIITEAYVFFKIVIPEIVESNGRPLLHQLTGIWFLFNVFFNYVMCIVTKPGTTLDVAPETLESAYPEHPRYCDKCVRVKPPFTHHCRICKKCVLKMDHHCPWVANCVGFFNYKYFFLFIFWLWLGSLYAQIVMLQHVGWMIFPGFLSRPKFSRVRRGKGVEEFVNTLALVMPLGALIAVSILLVWHIYLVLTVQTTIDAPRFLQDKKQAKLMGMTWVNVYDIGWRNNFLEIFDVKGKRWWWIRWMLPSLSRKNGNGYQFQQVEDFTLLSQYNQGKQLVHWV
eukprot:TRINITY_DN9424_c1_g1_i1.p1 TRINITY_DN9424_c1_g1~~TRINITY_DN9424_c1_g1_i1.p1  ORF type:complete len:327 (-),score=23.34 TRINITY_DN9424_c1_g1_i1:23-1003(-)